MKKTQWTDALRNIRRNWVSFLSVLMISLLASVAYLGLVFSAEGLKESANTTYQAGQTADLEITTPTLFTQRDLEIPLWFKMAKRRWKSCSAPSPIASACRS